MRQGSTLPLINDFIHSLRLIPAAYPIQSPQLKHLLIAKQRERATLAQ